MQQDIVLIESPQQKKKYTRVKVIANKSVTKWKDKNLQAGKDYYYVVRPYKKSMMEKFFMASILKFLQVRFLLLLRD